MTEIVKKGPWWGSYEIPAGSGGHWRIGPAEFFVLRTENEWRIQRLEPGDPHADGFEAEIPVAVEEEIAGAEILRCGFRQTRPMLTLLPLTADRPVVVNPKSPFELPSREEATLFVGITIWLRILAGSRHGKQLIEFPLYRPSDTWFGPSPREGELCYAGRTTAHLQIERLVEAPYRAVSVVKIRNRASGSLSLEKLRIPMPNMSLYADAGGRLWTEEVTMERMQEGDHAVLKLGKGAPAQAGSATLVCGPRTDPGKGLLFRAFGSVIKGINRDE